MAVGRAYSVCKVEVLFDAYDEVEMIVDDAYDDLAAAVVVVADDDGDLSAAATHSALVLDRPYVVES